MPRSSKQSLSFVFLHQNPVCIPPISSCLIFISSAPYSQKLSTYTLPLMYVNQTPLLNDIILFFTVGIHCPDEHRMTHILSCSYY
jgi:hypothetical protein